MNHHSDYWSSVLFKQLVGTNTLAIAGNTDTGRTIRLYAFCSRSMYGGVVLVAINVNDSPRNVAFQSSFSLAPRQEYRLTAPGGNVSSTNIELNGVTLVPGPFGQLPPLNPIVVESNTYITLDPLSYAFFVFPDAAAPACSS